MGDVNYAPLIRDMVWSYSRLQSYESCPYGWYLKYIYQLPHKSRRFFSSYGSLLHSLIEKYLSGAETKDSLITEYLIEFSEISQLAPGSKILQSYFRDGLQYLKSMTNLPCAVVTLEEHVDFELNGIRFQGYIDCLGKTDKGFVIVDHKSRTLKPRSKRSKPTKGDELLDEYLAQLYLYATAVEAKYGELPIGLWLNCFRAGLIIQEPFHYEIYKKTQEEFAQKAEQLTHVTDFPPNWEYFKCNYLCDMAEYCEYHEMNSQKR